VNNWTVGRFWITRRSPTRANDTTPRRPKKLDLEDDSPAVQPVCAWVWGDAGREVNGERLRPSAQGVTSWPRQVAAVRQVGLRTGSSLWSLAHRQIGVVDMYFGRAAPPMLVIVVTWGT
jgi:hypothetical protein